MKRLDGDRTPDQERAVGRVQLVAVIVLIGLIVGVRILGDETSMGTARILALFAAGGVLLLVVVSVLVARIDRRPVREVMGHATRDVGADVTKLVARIRRR
jgi:hypothetical protein